MTILRDMMLLRYGWLRASFAVVVLAVLFFAARGVDVVFELGWATGLRQTFDTIAFWKR